MSFAIASVGNVFNVGAFDAKTYFSELLRKAQEGAVINISKNGKQIAVLQGTKTVQNKAAFDAHKRIMARSEKFAQMKKENGFSAITSSEIKELKNAGRKY